MPRFPHSFHAVTLMTVATSFIVFRGAPAAPPPGSEDLVGTWRLVSYEDWDATGKVSRPYGEYFGTYSVDRLHGTFVTHVEGSLNPMYTNTDQPRPFVLKGDTLIIGDQKTWKRVLERVH